MSDLHWWSASDLAAAIRGREVSSSEALDHLVARIDRLDGPVNAVVCRDLERARAAAHAADQGVARGDELGPLHGVPITIKDSFSTEGCVTTSGARRLADHVPDADAWPVARLRAAGAIPFAIRGDAGGKQGYQLWTIVRADSPYQTLAELKGRKVAHVAPSSNSGNLAPRALVAAEGLVPDKDYKVLYSGRHENSVTGVASGDYDAAHVASDVVLRMEDRGLIKRGEMRVLFKSPHFPPGSMSMAHDLRPELQQKIRDCVLRYRYSPEMVKAFQGADRWWPVEYRRDWEAVRKVAAATGEAFDRKTLEREQERGKR